MCVKPEEAMRRTRKSLVILALILACAFAGCRKAPSPESSRGDRDVTETVERRRQLIEANILGAHAHQIVMHLRDRKGDAEAFGDGGRSADELAALVKAHERLAKSDPAEVAKWVAGETSRFDPADALEPLVDSGLALAEELPVSATTLALREQAPDVAEEKARALASLVQVALEVSRDGDILQDMMRLYLPLGLLAGPTDFGIADDNKAFYEFATRITTRCCKGPFATKRSSFQIALRKIQNWNLKHRGIGRSEYADEVLAREDIEPIVAKIRSLDAQRILVIGHSYTMQVHWSTLAPMNEIAAAVFEKENPGVVFAHMGHGGMTAWQAREKFLTDALAWKPNKVLIVTRLAEDHDFEALEEMSRKFKAIGCRTIVFDSISVSGVDQLVMHNVDRLNALAGRAPISVIPVAQTLETHPEKSDFIALDHIHMRPSYHKFMAGELLKFLVSSGE